MNYEGWKSPVSDLLPPSSFRLHPWLEDVMADDKSTASMALPQGKQPTLRVVPMPADSNSTGDIFGGWVMSRSMMSGGRVWYRRNNNAR